MLQVQAVGLKNGWFRILVGDCAPRRIVAEGVGRQGAGSPLV